jgi:hypothetical protein
VHACTPPSVLRTQAEQSLELVRSAESSQRNLLSTLEGAMDDSYQAAQRALRGGDEAGARALLVERQALKAKVVAAEAEIAEASRRVVTMQQSVAALAERAGEIESVISRAVVANSKGGGTGSGVVADGLGFGGMGAADEKLDDPLLRKFKELEGR